MPAYKRRGDCCCNPVPPNTVILGNCSCAAPLSVSVTVSYINGANAGTYGGFFANSTLVYGSTAPAYMSPVYSGPGLWSTTTWLRDPDFPGQDGEECCYRLNCAKSGTTDVFALSFYWKSLGVWQNYGTVMFYFMTGSNSCSPFLLQSGTVAGPNANARFLVSG